jgi:ABC-type phosphate transport system substrate-binding protein
VPPRTSKVIANDALVFYCADDFPTDTISAEQMKAVLLGKKSMTSMFPRLKTEPVFAITNELSSEYENARSMIANYEKMNFKRTYFSTYDSVINFVKNTPGAVGIGYYSQIVNKIGIKPLSVGFVDSTGAYIYPRVVHQSNIIQKLYPYIVDHNIYILDPNNNEAMRFLRYIRSPKGPAQRHFLEKGIVPAVGEFRLTPLYE